MDGNGLFPIRGVVHSQSANSFGYKTLLKAKDLAPTVVLFSIDALFLLFFCFFDFLSFLHRYWFGLF
jgi:hypothetical protein